jgi:hypothetical protein
MLPRHVPRRFRLLSYAVDSDGETRQLLLHLLSVLLNSPTVKPNFPVSGYFGTLFVPEAVQIFKKFAFHHPKK